MSLSWTRAVHKNLPSAISEHDKHTMHISFSIVSAVSNPLARAQYQSCLLGIRTDTLMFGDTTVRDSAPPPQNSAGEIPKLTRPCSHSLQQGWPNSRLRPFFRFCENLFAASVRSIGLHSTTFFGKPHFCEEAFS